jgi:hypothetical protein
VKEALMCNLPVVATGAGDVRDLLSGVDPSEVCEPSAEALGEALVGCLIPPRRSNGRATAARLKSEVVANRLLDLYSSVARAPLRVMRDGDFSTRELGSRREPDCHADDAPARSSDLETGGIA